MESRIIITRVIKDVYCIREMDYQEGCNCYLIVGSEKCLLVDTGIGFIDFSFLLKKYVKKKELLVIVTHFHFDHFAGSVQFKKVFANKTNISGKDIGLKYLKRDDFSDKLFYEEVKKCKINEGLFEHIEEKKVIDLGNFKFEIFYTPGHDGSSISLFEKEEEILFSGDCLYDGELYYDFLDSDMEEFVFSLNKLLSLNPKLICGGHNLPVKNDLSLIKNKIQFMQEVAYGRQNFNKQS